MGRPPNHLRAPGALAALGLAACEASDNRVDPGDLALRDLLGFEPEVAAAWDADQRASAREVIAPALADSVPLVNPVLLAACKACCPAS